MSEFEVPDLIKCEAALVICTHAADHPCRACHVKAWAVLEAVGPALLAIELDQQASVVGGAAAETLRLRATRLRSRGNPA